MKPTSTSITSAPSPRRARLCWLGRTTPPTRSTRSRSQADNIWESVTDAADRKLKIRLLPIPDHPIRCTEADCAAYDFCPR